MKKTGLFWCLALVLFIVSCGRKTVPVETNANQSKVLPPSKTDTRVGKHQKDSVQAATKPMEAKGDTVSIPVTTEPNAYTKSFTVVDSHGRLLLDPDNMPTDIAPDWIALKNIRAFTPAQAQTMASRFNTVPPRVIYVPAHMAKSGRKGKYYIYSKKFWYWKKSDGLFYLDTNYYQ